MNLQTALSPDPAVREIMADKQKFVVVKNKAGNIVEASVHKAKEMLARGELWPDTYIPYQLTQKELAEQDKDEQARIAFIEKKKRTEEAQLAQRAAVVEAAANFSKSKPIEEEIVPMDNDEPVVKRGRPAKAAE